MRSIQEMLETGVSGILCGIALKVIGPSLIPLLVLYSIARADFACFNFKTANYLKTSQFCFVFLLCTSIGFFRPIEKRPSGIDDGTVEAVRGSLPSHSRAKELPSFKNIYLTEEARPTYDGWVQAGIVDQQEATLFAPRPTKAIPLGSWVVAKCRRSPGKKTFCSYLSNEVLVSGPQSLRHRVARTRLKSIQQFLRQEPPGEQSTGVRYAAALATGARSLIPPLEIDRLARLGLLHLWAVSGLHVMIVAGFILLTIQAIYLRVLRNRTRPAPSVVAGLCSLPFVFLYAAFCGLGPSVVRAAIAFTIFVMFRWARRSLSPPILLLLTLALELSQPTEELLKVGSLFSHSAVLGIILVFQGTAQKRVQTRKTFASSIKSLGQIGLAATFATAPFQIQFFGSFSPMGVVLGIVMVPLFGCIVLPLCLMTLVMMAIGIPESCIVLAKSASSTLMSTVHTALLWVDHPRLKISVLPELSLLCACLVVMTFWMWLKPTRRRPLFFILGCTLCTAYLFPNISAPHEGTSIRAFDVGHGDAFLITTSEGTTTLIDTGAGESNGRGSKLNPNRLRRLGVSQIDLLILSHRHPDHYGGTFRLVNDIPIKRCIIPKAPAMVPMSQWQELLKVMKMAGVHCQAVEQGQKLQIFDLNVEILAPLNTEGFEDPEKPEDQNSWSIAAHISTRDGHIWSFGDAPKSLEMDIMALNPTLIRGGVLLVPHHGSKTSSSQELLDGLKPSTALVSHKRSIPKEVYNRYQKRHIPLCGTNLGGTVHIKLVKQKVWVPLACLSENHTTQSH